jgi:hypothetical protein
VAPWAPTISSSISPPLTCLAWSWSASAELIGIERRPCRDFGPVSRPSTIAQCTSMGG